MPKTSEILKIENSPRESARDKRTVRLVKMGAFLRAYDWSAWLVKRYGSPLNVGLDKGDGAGHVFVGFPISSADKFVPEGCESIKDAEGVESQWIFPATSFPPEENYDILDKEYVKWQSETLTALESELKEKKRKKETKGQGYTAQRQQVSEDDTAPEDVSASPLRLTDVARQILRFPLDRRSPDDCVRFIRQIQGELLDLL